MRRLSKRWEPLKRVTYRALYRSFLSEVQFCGEAMCWGCIEAPSLDGPFRFEVWNPTEGEWEFVQSFPTLKEAKTVGRLLAGVALNQNI